MSKLKFSESKSEEPGLAALAQGLRRLAADASVETLQQETVAVAVSLCGAERGYWAAAGETACIGDTTCFALGDGMVVLEHAQAVDAALLDILATAASIALTNAALREQSRQDQSTTGLAFERTLLHTLVDNIPFRIYAKDRESRFLFGNNRMARLAGVETPPQLIGKTDYDFFPAELAAKYFADEKQVMDSGRSLFDYEELVEDQDTGELGWTVTTKVLLRGADGAVNGIVGIGYDVTQRKLMEERLRERTQELEEANARLEAEKEQQQVLIRKLSDMQGQLLQSEKMASIGLLAAGVAHEINNPLAFISSNFGALERDAKDILKLISAFEGVEGLLPGDARAPVAFMKEDIGLDDIRQDLDALFAESREGLQRVKHIVQNLKDFSRPGGTEKEMADLEQGLDSTLNVAWNEIKYKADVVKEYAGVPELYCLPSQINQVFLNLLINAAHAIEGKGTIIVRTGHDEKVVWVEIEDNGCGIAPAHLDHIFEPFFTTKPVGKGTGLGLSIVYGIVQGHRGTIAVKSEVGKGTVFRVALPRT
ncbi:PAS domain-containing protein [Massilia sp. NEAU-DD11]|uniref:histidine kinase n=1 Tax=Massilia cellulosiltytica TaxID=2683234 RepID=A0A7X3FUZ7_9BURK|nr:ATP-binding protein [Telluria cellulosilytica]MVW58476.1 PAS domain-containing protein [Telluria cellulosilytica]